MADRYYEVITDILDDLVPMTELTVLNRPHRPFYDEDCKHAHRTTRHREQVYRNKKGTPGELDALSAWCEALKGSIRLARMKGREYWRRALDTAKYDTKQTRKHLDKLCGKTGMAPSSDACFSAEDYHRYIDEKIKGIQDRSTGAEPPVYSIHTDSSLPTFSPPMVTEDVALVRASPDSVQQTQY